MNPKIKLQLAKALPLFYQDNFHVIKQLSLQSATLGHFLVIMVMHCTQKLHFGKILSNKSNLFSLDILQLSKLGTTRDGNSLAIFIPRGFEGSLRNFEEYAGCPTDILTTSDSILKILKPHMPKSKTYFEILGK